MATFNFNRDVNVQGDQNVVGRDMIIGADRDRAGAIEMLTDLLDTTRKAIASGTLEQGPGDQATAEISAAITALAEPDPDAPRRARLSLARTREVLTTVTLVPALAEAVIKAIEAVRGLH
jgi:hypothetical protein